MKSNSFIVICALLFLRLHNCEAFSGSIFEVECKEWCEKGERVSKEIPPDVNGCGTDSVPKFIRDKFSENITDCCNDHDVCYEDCFKTKKQCDDEFESCIKMYRKDSFVDVIKEKLKDGFLSKLTEGFLMPELVKTFGCAAYERALDRGCYCIQNNVHIRLKG